MLDGYSKDYEQFGVSREQWRQMGFNDRLSLARKADADSAKYAGDASQLYKTNTILNWAKIIGGAIGDQYQKSHRAPSGYDFARPFAAVGSAAGRVAAETALPRISAKLPGSQARAFAQAASKAPIKAVGMVGPAAAAFAAGDMVAEPMIDKRSMEASKDYYGRMGLKGAVAQMFPAYANLIGKAVPKVAQWTGAVTPEEAQSMSQKRRGDSVFGKMPWQQ